MHKGSKMVVVRDRITGKLVKAESDHTYFKHEKKREAERIRERLERTGEYEVISITLT